MQRQHLEYIIRAAAGITGASDIVIVGSQAVLGQYPEAAAELIASIEADVFSLRDPLDSDLIDGSIGEGSPFHKTFGYYAHGVASDAAILPEGWRERLIPVRNANTGNGTGWCLDIHDLAVAKLVAGREKDMVFVTGLLAHRMADADLIATRLGATRLDSDRLKSCEARLKRIST